jgi:hypothetical protein
MIAEPLRGDVEHGAREIDTAVPKTGHGGEQVLGQITGSHPKLHDQPVRRYSGLELGQDEVEEPQAVGRRLKARRPSGRIGSVVKFMIRANDLRHPLLLVPDASLATRNEEVGP